MTTTSFWSWPFNCWSAVVASAAAELDGAWDLSPCRVLLRRGRCCLRARDPRVDRRLRRVRGHGLARRGDGARHVTNALQTLLAHVEVSVLEPDVVVAAVVAADLLLEPQAACRKDDRNGGDQRGAAAWKARTYGQAHLFGAAETSSEPDETSPGRVPRQCLCDRGIISGG